LVVVFREIFYCKMNSTLKTLLVFIACYTAAEAAGIVGDRISGTWNVPADGASYQISCENSVNITVNASDPFWNSFYENHNQTFYINQYEQTITQYGSMNAECKPFKANNNTLNWYLDIEACAPKITTNDTDITYEYTIWMDPKQNLTVFPTDNIARYVLKNATFKCQYNRTMTNTTSSSIQPNIRHGSYQLTDLVGYFSMGLSYADGSYIAANAPATVDVDDFIFVKATLQANSIIKMKFKECWAHQNPSDSKTASGSYLLIDAGCPVNSTHDNNGTIVITTNGNQNYAEFKFRSFVWNSASTVTTGRETQTIYTTCVMTACRNSCASSCSYSQNTKLTRRRRSADQDGFEAVLMAGPIEVIPS